MKKLSKIKLTQFSKKELENRQMNAIRGGKEGCGCICSCYSDDCSCSGDANTYGLNWSYEYENYTYCSDNGFTSNNVTLSAISGDDPYY